MKRCASRECIWEEDSWVDGLSNFEWEYLWEGSHVVFVLFAVSYGRRMLEAVFLKFQAFRLFREENLRERFFCSMTWHLSFLGNSESHVRRVGGNSFLKFLVFSIAREKKLAGKNFDSKIVAPSFLRFWERSEKIFWCRGFWKGKIFCWWLVSVEGCLLENGNQFITLSFFFGPFLAFCNACMHFRCPSVYNRK